MAQIITPAVEQTLSISETTPDFAPMAFPLNPVEMTGTLANTITVSTFVPVVLPVTLIPAPLVASPDLAAEVSLAYLSTPGGGGAATHASGSIG